MPNPAVNQKWVTSLPMVSVVMPTLNQAEFIEASIVSVLSQSYPRLEVVVSDGGSSDGTLDILKRIAAVDARLRWVSATDTGPAQAINRALELTRGTYIGWLNSDDLYTPGAIERAVQALAANNDWLMVYGHGQHIDRAGRVIENYPTLGPETSVARLADGCFICQPTVFFKRVFWVILGKLDESLKTAFDFDYWFRAFTGMPERIGFVHHVQAQSRLYPECITFRLRAKVFREGMQVVARHRGHAPRHWVLSYLNELLNADPQAARRNETEAAIGNLTVDVASTMTTHEQMLLQRDIAKRLGLRVPAVDVTAIPDSKYTPLPPGPWVPTEALLAPKWGRIVFDQAVSLGFFCHSAYALRALGVRAFSGPFDWIFSTSAIVEHAISDNFSTFLDASQYEPVPLNLREDAHANMCDHRLYRDKFGRKYLFNHHSPDLPNDYAFFSRSVERFRYLLRENNPILFVAFDREGESLIELQRMCTSLRKHSEYCYVLVIRFLNANHERLEPGVVQLEYHDERLLVLRFVTEGPSSGIEFMSDCDNKNLANLLSGFEIKDHARKAVLIKSEDA